MKKLTTAIFIAFFLIVSVSVNGQNPSEQEHSNTQIIVKLKQAFDLPSKGIIQIKTGDQNFDQLNIQEGVQNISLTGNIKLGNTFLIEFKNEKNISSTIKKYEDLGLFEYVEPNYIGFAGGVKTTTASLPNDTYFERQYSLYNDGSFDKLPSVNDADIDMDEAWDIQKGDSNIVVAVLDAGLRLSHPDLKGRIWNNKAETTDGKDDDNNKYVDDIVGWDFINKDNDPTDDHGHGTNVTGIIAAKPDNNLGYAGVDWHCKIMTCKILNNNGTGLYTQWAEAIYYAVDNGAHILNMSVGGRNYSKTLFDAIKYAHDKGVTIVACMMNYNNNVQYYPAAFSQTIAVGATNPNDERADPFTWSATSGSNFGAHIDLVAPGNYIYGLKYSSDTDYGSYWGGTSQATPHVAGVCALLLAQDKNRTPEDLRKILRATSEDEVGKSTEDVEGFDIYHGYGRLNAFKALTYVPVSAPSVDEYQNVQVYPNPSFGNLVVESELEIKSIEIYNAHGALMYSQKSGKKRTFIDTKNFSKGVYQIVVKTEKGSRTEKIMLQ